MEGGPLEACTPELGAEWCLGSKSRSLGRRCVWKSRGGAEVWGIEGIY